MQAHGITMKSSSISLLNVPGEPGHAAKAEWGHLNNLIGFSGHVLLCSEVCAGLVAASIAPELSLVAADLPRSLRHHSRMRPGLCTTCWWVTNPVHDQLACT